jgi:hypothetical protein
VNIDGSAIGAAAATGRHVVSVWRVNIATSAVLKLFPTWPETERPLLPPAEI